MAAKITLVSITLLLTVAPIATMATSTPTATTSSLPSALLDVPKLPFPLVGEATDAAADCWKAVVQADSCAADILPWLAAPELAVRVSPACCSVLRTVGDRCIHELFPASTFGQLYAPLVSQACGIPKRATPSGRQ
ncbi:hypothetical protein ACQ4PT_071772 [Festuca glaucescens]